VTKKKEDKVWFSQEKGITKWKSGKEEGVSGGSTKGRSHLIRERR